MSKSSCEILNKFKNHGGIIMTYTTVINKCMITLEVSTSKHWLRVYKNGELYREKNYKHYKNAIGSFYRYIKKLNFKYNYYEKGLKYYEHK